jgi:hypothetical protein
MNCQIANRTVNSGYSERSDYRRAAGSRCYQSKSTTTRTSNRESTIRWATPWTTYEVDDDTLTIWGGEKGSPAYYKGMWSDDGNTNAGAWVYPDGGYESTMTRIK